MSRRKFKKFYIKFLRKRLKKFLKDFSKSDFTFKQIFSSDFSKKTKPSNVYDLTYINIQQLIQV